METLIVFHSVLGLRRVEQEAAERFRSAGFRVVVPDLYAGNRTDSIDEGFELMAQIGWSVICKRAREAMTALPESTVLVGFSMGAGVVANLWPHRPGTEAVLLFHGLAEVPAYVRQGLKLQLHMAELDNFVSPEQTNLWTAAAAQAGILMESFTYAHCGHFFTDSESSDYSPVASELAWTRALSFLAQL